MFPSAPPEAVGLPPDTATPFVEALSVWAANEAVVGAELHIIKDRRTVVHQAVGWADRERAVALERDAIFRIRSMAKPFVGTAVLMLAEAGQLKLSDPVAAHLPSFDHPRSRLVTIEHLLRHVGGLDHPGFPLPLGSYGCLREAVDDVGRTGPAAEPGSRFCYSDASSAVLGAVAAAVAGEPLEDLIEARIAKPLGLADTSCRLLEDKHDRLCSGYQLRAGRFVRYWDRFAPPRLPFFRASGGMFGTTADYARFLSVWMDGGRFGSARLLFESSVRAALDPAPQSRGFQGYGGYGQHWILYSLPDPQDERALLVFGHEGSDGTWAMACPCLDLMVLYFTQSRGGETVHEVMRLVGELVARCEQTRPPRLSP